MAHPVVKARGRSGAHIDALALSVVRKYQPSMLNCLHAFDVERFFELELPAFTGIKTDYQKLGWGVHAYTDITEMKCVVSLDLMNNQEQHAFLRSTLAHEIGHCHMHVPEFLRRKAAAKFIHDGANTLRLYHQEALKVFENPEWQAWRYAGALMMPAQSVMIAVTHGLTVKEMSKVFEVYQPFVSTRLRALGLAGKVRMF
jgi:hypothetical protein